MRVRLGKKYKDCCGAPRGEIENMHVKEINTFEFTPGLANPLSTSLDPSYLEYFTADPFIIDEEDTLRVYIVLAPGATMSPNIGSGFSLACA